MISLDIKDNKILSVASVYDSGKHTGINICTLSSEDWSYHKGLEQMLTREQIKGLEAVIATTIKMYLDQGE